jgi:hypothetical protein
MSSSCIINKARWSSGTNSLFNTLGGSRHAEVVTSSKPAYEGAPFRRSSSRLHLPLLRAENALDKDSLSHLLGKGLSEPASRYPSRKYWTGVLVPNLGVANASYPCFYPCLAVLISASPARYMTHIPPARSYFDKLTQHANALIPALGGGCDEEDGPYMAFGDIRRFFFQPARTLAEQRQVLTFINHSLEIGGGYTE